MRIFPEWTRKLSDDEYIERIRKNVKATRWTRYFHGFMALFYVGIIIGGTVFLLKFLQNDAFNKQEQDLIYSAFVLAIIFGLLVSQWIAQAFLAAANAFSGQRKDRLLVECWDALHRDPEAE